MIFEGSAQSVRLLSYAVIFVALAAFGLSIKRSVEICGAGGVQDVLPLSSADQARVLNILAGAEGGTKTSKRAPSVEVKAEPAKPKAKSAAVESEKAIEETIEVAPGQPISEA